MKDAALSADPTRTTDEDYDTIYMYDIGGGNFGSL